MKVKISIAHSRADIVESYLNGFKFTKDATGKDCTDFEIEIQDYFLPNLLITFFHAGIETGKQIFQHDSTSNVISDTSVNDSNPPVQERGAVSEEHSQVLPEKWCVFNEGTEDFQCLIAYANLHGCVRPYYLNEKHYYHFPGFWNGERECTTSEQIKTGYTEISLQDFKKLVLCQTT